MDEWMNTYKQQEDHPKFPHILHNQIKMLEIIRLNSVENFPPENAHADFIPFIHAVSIYCMLPGNPAVEGRKPRKWKASVLPAEVGAIVKQTRYI